MAKMLKPTGPEIDANAKNGETDKCAKMAKPVKMVKMSTPTWSKFGTAAKNAKTDKRAKLVKLVKVEKRKTGRGPEWQMR